MSQEIRPTLTVSDTDMTQGRAWECGMAALVRLLHEGSISVAAVALGLEIVAWHALVLRGML